MRHVAPIAIIGITLLAGSSTQADQIRQGKWEITSTTEAPETIAGIHNQQSKVIICVDDQNAGKPPIWIDPSCSIIDYKITNTSASWTMECLGQLRMSGAGSLMFNGDLYVGSLTMRREVRGAKPMIVRTDYIGKRLGGC